MNIFKFLVDANLPKMFSFFNKPEFKHVSDLKLDMSDNEIWNYALQHGFVILTKDSDFYHQCLVNIHTPKIVYFKLGNQTLKQLHDFFEKNWDLIIAQLPTTKLMVVEKDQIVIILEEA